MEELQSYSPQDVILQNLQELFPRFSVVCEQEILHLRELATEVAKTVSDASDFLASLPDLRPEEPEADGRIPAGMTALYAVSLRILFALELQAQIPELKTARQEFFFPPAPDFPDGDRIAYQRSSFTDEAYLRFASILKAPRVSYAHSFRSVCEDVFNGLCSYCILPIENSSEGRLSSFLRLIHEFDLKIAAVCEIESGAGKTTRFALLSRSVTSLCMESKNRFLSLSVSPKPIERALDLFTAARLCGLSVRSSEWNRNGDVCLTLSTEQSNPAAFLLYLAMDFPDVTPLGIYPEIS